ncbi:MAG TPA: dihydrolipoamide acetyltransferase family protein [Gaiellaceae bacterium]|nr:dihydrolipoamide acetyltransferase family protein [Gaiellaceae bacterium]
MPPRELTMPKLSDSMADAVILRWLKSAGEPFARGEGLIEVETDKATVVYEAEWDGTLDAILVPEGATVAVGEPIATLANGDGAAREASPAPTRAQPEPVAPTPPAAAKAEPTSVSDGSAPGRAVATPVARRTAVELGISLHGIAGTGPGGRITVEDVQRAATEAPTTPTGASASGKGEVTVYEPTPTQATIARRMVASATTIPVFTVSADVDVSQIVAWRRDARDKGEGAPSLNDFVVKATAATLREFPRFNASYVDGKVECYARVNVGIAVATDDALLVPVIRDADLKSLTELAEETRALADGARRRALKPEDFHDGTFTVSNLGMFGVRAFTAIIDPPQVAILAVGGARRAPFEEAADRVAFRDLLTVTLSCDHRVVYGADGARFLSRLRELLERPLALAL